MTDYSDPRRTSERLGNTDRDEAVARLAAARDDGRLTPEEYDARASTTRMAVTRGDLTPLFSDLPLGADTPPAVYSTPPSGAIPTPVGTPGARAGALGGAWGATLVALSPFIAIALFFLFGFTSSFTWSWVFFLLIPVAGIVVYGPGARYRR
ncbi:DUF1707 SHOCT-like domain-containing protein [Glaciibacter flavus]|uniref:DUF1707 SHOCT-like domain-containing protein n=1 Tax=Orlajensenia flava TaxID=2565934 RepID=UPI003B0001B4